MGHELTSLRELSRSDLRLTFLLCLLYTASVFQVSG
jgi:hypothetical protein